VEVTSRRIRSRHRARMGGDLPTFLGTILITGRSKLQMTGQGNNLVRGYFEKTILRSVG
jgi:hypothetical protein